MGQAGEVKLDSPRPLNTAEQHIPAALLADEFPGAEALRAQAEQAQVVGRCDCGCPTIDLSVPTEVPSSPVATRNRLAPVEGRVRPTANEPVADIILFVDEGRLSSLELVSYTDQPPSEWPLLDRVTIQRTDTP